jgi:prohibitin 1
MKARNNNSNNRSKQGLPFVRKTTLTKLASSVATIVAVVSRLDNNILPLFHFHVSAFSPPSFSASPPSAAFRGSTFGSNNGNAIVYHATQTLGVNVNNPSRSLVSPSTSVVTSPIALFSNKKNSIEDVVSKKNDWSILTSAKVGGVFLVTILLALKSVYVVDAGEIGIASTFGSLERYDPGFHLRNPLLTSVDRLSTKTELLEQSNFVPTKEGLTVELDTSVLVRLDPDRAVELYRSVGPEFIRKLVIPEASSSVRGLTSESEAKALYTSGRIELHNRMKDELTEKLGPKGILVEDVLLKNVVLPKDLSDSIQEKARAEQESARMEFVLLKESQEAKRKAIEAEGIAEFQRIVSKGITPSLLQWKGIEATEKFAKSPNTKIVIMGNSKDSLPVILGSESK